jgi:hypothetical protein
LAGRHPDGKCKSVAEVAATPKLHIPRASRGNFLLHIGGAMVHGCSNRHIAFSFQVHSRVHNCTPVERAGMVTRKMMTQMTCTV